MPVIREDLDIVRQLVVNGLIKNFTQCMNNATVKAVAATAKQPNDDVAMTQTRTNLCKGFYTDATIAALGDTMDRRKPLYKT